MFSIIYTVPSKGVSGGPVITPLNLVRSDWSITSTLIAHCCAYIKTFNLLYQDENKSFMCILFPFIAYMCNDLCRKLETIFNHSVKGANFLEEVRYIHNIISIATVNPMLMTCSSTEQPFRISCSQFQNFLTQCASTKTPRTG